MRTNKTPLLLFGLIISISSFSQFSAGLEIDRATSHFSDIRLFGFGGSIRYEAPIQNKLSWTCTLGHSTFFDTILDGYQTSNRITSVAGGVKYYFSEAGKGFYATTDLGTSFLSYSHTSIRTIQSGTYPYAYEYSYSSTRTDVLYTFSPGVGYRINQWDFTGRCNIISQASHLSLRAAYVFQSKKK